MTVEFSWNQRSEPVKSKQAEKQRVYRAIA